MSENNKNDKWYDNENTFMYAGLTACVVAVITPFLILLFVCLSGKTIDFDHLGLVGDFFGGITVGLFNLASILLVLATVRIQGKELRETRTEFETTNETLIKQQFDNTFFNMINLHNEIVRTLEYKDLSGRAVLIDFQFNVKSRAVGLLNLDDEINHILKVYEDSYKSRAFVIGHYLRNIYRIVKFIDQSELSNDEKKNYIGILRAQLSTDELMILFLIL
nr:putative phage abortive infection protein [Bacillus subtilis]